MKNINIVKYKNNDEKTNKKINKNYNVRYIFQNVQDRM